MKKPRSAPEAEAQLVANGQRPSGMLHFSPPTDEFPPKELTWREPPQPLKLPSGNDTMTRVSCWENVNSARAIEVSSATEDNFHVITLLKRRTKAELFIEGRSVWKGGMPDQLLITGPRRGLWRKVITPPYEHLRVYLPQQLIAECFEEITGYEAPGIIYLCEATSISDPGLSHILRALLQAEIHDNGNLSCFTETLGLALGSRLVTSLREEFLPHVDETPNLSEKICIQRTLEYINEHLHTSITLAELSNIFGASRCRFTAKFKQHTGFTPHAYILRRKIIRAKELLKQTKTPIIEVALDLGFNSQPHFTSVFRREVGMTPARWRHENL